MLSASEMTSAAMLRKVVKETAAELAAEEGLLVPIAGRTRTAAETKAMPSWFCKNWETVRAGLQLLGGSKNWLVKLACRLLIDVGDELAKKCPA